MSQPTSGSRSSEPEQSAGSSDRSQAETGDRPVSTEQERAGRQPEQGTTAAAQATKSRAGDSSATKSMETRESTAPAESTESKGSAESTESTASAESTGSTDTDSRAATKAGKRRASVPEQPTAPAPERTTAETMEDTPAEVRPEPVTTAAPTHLAARPHWIWGLTRIALGWVFLWAFLDKLFGLGYATPANQSWLDGSSPTEGYLSGVDGPFRSFFNPMAGQPWADWLFMVGLAAIGLALVLGIGVRIAAIAGTILLVFMWMAAWPITQNPFLDEHLVYALVLIGLAVVNAGDTVGFGRVWSRTGLVRALPVLR